MHFTPRIPEQNKVFDTIAVFVVTIIALRIGYLISEIMVRVWN